MISNPTEQDFPLNNPQTLQQMRYQLLALVQQDQQALSYNLRDFQTYFSQYQQTSTDCSGQRQSSVFVPFQFLKENEDNLKEKSNCITTLAQLSVRLIDCVLDQQQNNASILEQYQRQIEMLKEQIDCLASKNQFIQNDAEYFKQHLKDVERELQNMTKEQITNDFQGNLEEYNEKDRQIGVLEQELQRIKNELQFYKFSTRSKKSSLQLKQHLLLSIRSQNTLLSSENIPSLGNLNELEYQNTIHKLESENENLKRELQMTKRSRVSNRMSNQIKEELQQTERMPNTYEFDQYKQNIVKSSSVRFFEKGLLHDFREYLQSPRTKFDEENTCNPTPVSQLVEVVKSQALNHQWSTHSFNLVSDLKSAELIYLNQEEDQQYNKVQQLYTNIIQQTKETEGSIRQIEIQTQKVQKLMESVGVNTNTHDIQKYMQSLGVNTDDSNVPVEQKETKKITFIQRIKQIQFPYMEQISNFFIRNRLRRNVLKVNQSLLLINS